jgi:peptide deformylase
MSAPYHSDDLPALWRPLLSLLRIVKVDDGNPVLRAKCKPARRIDRATRTLMDDMVETMRDAPGVGLAAPQVGVDLRVIVVEVPVDPEDETEEAAMHLWALADPKIVWASEETVEDQEACLSIPHLYGDVPRHVAIHVEALDRSGRNLKLELEGFAARVFQHEIDHLDGILFTDRVTGFDKLYRFEEDNKGDMVRVPYEPEALL